MALKLKSDKLFKATVKLNDELEKEVTFRLPRVVDVYSSSDGNQLLNTIYTLANMAKPFDKPVQVVDDDGNITEKRIIDNNADVYLRDAIEKWSEARQKDEEEKERLVKKSELAGNSTKKATKYSEKTCNAISYITN